MVKSNWQKTILSGDFFIYLSRGNGKSQGALHGVERIAFQMESVYLMCETGRGRHGGKRKSNIF